MGLPAGFYGFQYQVFIWVRDVFGIKIALDKKERGHRFIEEAIELAQACGSTKQEVLDLVDYVYSRPVGEVDQEIGGVQLTLAALAHAYNLSIGVCGTLELERVNTPEIKAKVKAKHLSKPANSSLPGKEDTHNG